MNLSKKQSPNIAILFWFYKDLDLCKNRLEILKNKNPEKKIFGLFAGDPGEARLYGDVLAKYLDDFYAFYSNDGPWKWLHGDLILLEWFEQRGCKLKWDSLAIAQWDILILEDIDKIFAGIVKDQIFLSGLKIIDAYLEKRWKWTNPAQKESKEYRDFSQYIKEKYNYHEKLLACIFAFQIFPRIFFEKYLGIQNKMFGMLEYKIPTYAKILNIPFFEKDLNVLWHDEQEPKAINAWKIEIEDLYIKTELQKKDGCRIFHPYYKDFKLD